MLVGTEHALLPLGYSSRLPTSAQGACFLIQSCEALVRAEWTDELFDQIFANLFVHVDTFSVEPILAIFATYHPPVVVCPPA